MMSRSSPSRSSGPKPGSRRPSISTSISEGMTFSAEPPRTMVALTVFLSAPSSCLPCSPISRSAAPWVRGSSSARSTSRLRAGQRVGDRLDGRPHHRRHVWRRPLAVERPQHRCEPRHRATAHRPRRVAPRATHRRLDVAQLLLGHLDRVEAAAAHVDGDAAHLAERMPDAGERVGMLVGQELRAEVPAGLLVGDHGEDEPARRHAALGLRPHERCDHHRHAALHVECASAPDHAVYDLRAEGRMRPLLARSRDDVDVTVEEERRAVARPGQPGDEVRSLGIARVELALDPRSREQPPHVLDALALRSRRVGRVEAKQVAQQLDRVGNHAHRAASASSSRSTSAWVL